jgi:hypothetical protein
MGTVEEAMNVSVEQVVKVLRERFPQHFDICVQAVQIGNLVEIISSHDLTPFMGEWVESEE